jgi:4-hydroxy-3-polyprenylbenzoate decarboxylase
MTTPRRIIVGISGASGTVYGLAVLRGLRAAGVETHLIMSDGARRTMELETELSFSDFAAETSVVHDVRNLAASISSGSFRTDGMVVVPCSIKSASSIANSLNGDLLTRAADVCLKERRLLVLVVRETPLHLGHLRIMTQLAEVGAVLLPPIPAMYAKPQSVDDIIAHTAGKVLDQFGIDNSLFSRWNGA